MKNVVKCFHQLKTSWEKFFFRENISFHFISCHGHHDQHMDNSAVLSTDVNNNRNSEIKYYYYRRKNGRLKFNLIRSKFFFQKSMLKRKMS